MEISDIYPAIKTEISLKDDVKTKPVFISDATANHCNLLFQASIFNNIRSQVTCPSWRNWLARSTVNRKVGGSSPPEGE